MDVATGDDLDRVLDALRPGDTLRVAASRAGTVVAAGVTDFTGTVHHDVARHGKYHVRLAEAKVPPPPRSGDGETPASSGAE